MTLRPIILSASACTSLKKCPFKYRNAYSLGIRRTEEADALRMGSSWHAGLEAMSLSPEQPCPMCSKQMYPDEHCPYCQGTGFIDDPIACLTRVIDYRYGALYPGMSRETREVERATILYSLLAYNLNYADTDGIEVIAREIPFRIPLVDPVTKRAVPNVFIDGMIDKLVRHQGKIKVMEHKSAGDSLEPESDYWSHLRLDLQTTLYPYAVQRLQMDGILEPYKIAAEDEPVGEVLYDVWRKPKIEPKKLSQADTTAFVTSGEYFGQTFEVLCNIEDGGVVGEAPIVVDGMPAELEFLKKGFAIRETPEMFGARLMTTISDEPDRYFARRGLARTSEDLERFEREIYAIYLTVRDMQEADSWYHNEHACEDHGRCDYRQFCYSGTELDPEHPPEGFANIFQKKGT